MKANRFKQVLAGGGVAVGHMVWEFPTRGMAGILATADIDFTVVDMEHTATGPGEVADFVGWLRGSDIAPFVRVPQPDYHFIARTLDAGALGVMIPNVESAAAAQAVVDAAKYAPLGKRGVGLGGAHTDYAQPNAAEYLEEANENTTVICQIESVAGVENAEAIAAVDGVDVLWVGHFDLTQSMGIPGRFDDPRFPEALAKVSDAASKHGKAAGIQPGGWGLADQCLELGYRVLSWKSDLVLYRAALQSEIKEVRERVR